MASLEGEVLGLLGNLEPYVVTLGRCWAIGGVVGTAVGTALGSVVGVGFAIPTFGLSIAIGTGIGAAAGAGLGACVGSVVGTRICAGALENNLLYHPQKYRNVDFVGKDFFFGEHTYICEKVGYDLDGRSGDDATQSAYLLRRHDGEACALWMLFGGNGMVARDWFQFLPLLLKPDRPAAPNVAFLLFDYPGYGANGGHPHQASVLRASRNALRAALAHFGPVQKLDVNLFGHSLGAAAAAQLAAQLSNDGEPSGRLLMSAPFLSIPHMAVELAGGLLQSLSLPSPPASLRTLARSAQPISRQLLPLLLQPVVPQLWANAAAVRVAARAGWHLGFVHGTMDEKVPVEMGVELHGIAKAEASSVGAPPATFAWIADAGHDDVLRVGLSEYARFMGLEGSIAAS